MTSGDRIPCVVPFCRRTARPECADTEIICGKHWRLASSILRRRYGRLARAYRRRFGSNGYWDYPPGSEQRIAAIKLGGMCNRLWDRIKRQAIERAGGI